MGGALSYLLAARLKNQLKSLVKSPGKMAYIAGIAAILLLTAFTAGRGDGTVRDIRELTAGIFVLYAFVFVLIAKNGFSRGASMFRMPDVNFVFPAPIGPQRVLFYGLFQQLGTSLLIGVFLLFQFAWLHNVYGIEYGAVVALLIGYGITVFCAQLTAMAIYSFTNANERRQRRVKTVFYGLIFVYIAVLLFYLLEGRAQILGSLVDTLNGTAFRLFPVAGWTANIVNGAIVQQLFWPLVGAALCAAYIAGVVVAIIKAKPDYYEDVLSSTERTEETLEAKRQGRVGEVAIRKVKNGKTGIGRGDGASTFYYKHLLENKRSRVFLLSPQMIIFALLIIVISFFMQEGGLAAVFIFATYMLLFSVAFGRFQKELLKPYVYLVPEPPFKKLIACIREGFAGYVVEAAIVFIPIGFIMGLTPLETLLCILARVSYAFLFVAANIVVGRVFGTLTSKMITLLAYFMAVVALSLPGIIAASALLQAHALLVSANGTMLLSIMAVNIPVALLALYLCRNMLEYTELNN